MSNLIIVTRQIHDPETTIPLMDGYHLVAADIAWAVDHLVWVGTFVQTQTKSPEVSAEQIIEALRNASSLAAAAKALGISVQTLKSRMSGHGIGFQPVIKEGE